MQNTSSGCKSDLLCVFRHSAFIISRFSAFHRLSLTWLTWSAQLTGLGTEVSCIYEAWSQLFVLRVQRLHLVSEVRWRWSGRMCLCVSQVNIEKKSFWCSLSWNSESCINKRGPASENKQLALYSVSEWLTGTRSNCFLKEKDGF